MACFKAGRGEIKVNKIKIVSIIMSVLLGLCALSSCKLAGEEDGRIQSEADSISTEADTLPSAVPEDMTEAEEPDDGSFVLKASSATAVLGNGKTYTGLEPLMLRDFKIEDPDNTRGLSEKKHEYGFGVAKDGKPNEQSVNNQKFFDENGFDALALDTVSKDKVLYLTFDCGYENGYTEKVLDVLKEKDVNAAFFCTLDEVKSNPEIIARMINEGHIVGNHSVTHPSFAELSRVEMAQEIKGMDDYLRINFGYSEPYFRFPMGEYSECALNLVNSLGYKCVFWSLAYADWDINAGKGKDYAVKTVCARLHPGAVILLHAVSPDNAAALPEIIDTARSRGYEFCSLRDYGELTSE